MPESCRVNKLRVAPLALALVLAACAQPGMATPTGMPAGSAASAMESQDAAFAGLDVLLTKSPTCGCCHAHAAYLRRFGMNVTERAAEDINAVKDVYAIPLEMRSCHTATIGRYFVEGHVPYAAIQQLFAQLPDIDGISLPGMPAGSPGMDGQLSGPLVVYAIRDGAVVGEFGSF